MRFGRRRETVIDCNSVYYRKPVQAKTGKKHRDRQRKGESVNKKQRGIGGKTVRGEKWSLHKRRREGESDHEGWWRGEGRLVSLLLDLPSPSLQAQVTPAPQPSALLTTNHLVLITRKFSPFLLSPPSVPLLPCLHALLCALAFAKVQLILF